MRPSEQIITLLGGAQVPNYEQIATGGNYVTPYAILTTDGTTTRQEDVALFVLGFDTPYIRLSYINYYVINDGSNVETNTGNAYTLECSCEIPTAPVTTPQLITHGGLSSGTVADGADDYNPDLILPSSFGISGNFKEGTVFYIHTSITVTAGQKIPHLTSSGTYQWAQQGASFLEKMVRNANASAQILTPGIPTGTAIKSKNPLVAIRGKPQKATISIAIGGDSIPSGSNDGFGSGYGGNGTNNGRGGPWVRAAWGVNSRNLPWLNFGAGGSGADATKYGKRKKLIKYCTHSIIHYQTNTLASGTTPAATLTALQGVTAFIAATCGITDITVSKITPRTIATLSVTSLTSSSTTATAQVASTAALSNGQSIIIAGATPSAYNGTYSITVIDSTHFSYTFAGGTSPATGTITFSDQFASTTNQTAVNHFGVGQEADQFNVLLDGTPGANGITRVHDLNPVLRDATLTYAWKVNGAANGYTNDGLHFTTASPFVSEVAASGLLNTLYGTFTPLKPGVAYVGP